MISVERLTPEDWRAWRDLRLFALREAPHAFSSTLADWQGEGDSEERWRNRLSAVPFNVIAYLDGAPAGMVSGMPWSSDGAVALDADSGDPGERIMIRAIEGRCGHDMA